MNIFSSDEKNNCSSNSSLRIINSLRNRPIVLSTLCFKTSLMVRKQGLLSSITQQLGEILISQSLNAYSASMVLSNEIPGAKCTKISTSAAVLSSTFFAFIFPLSIAFSIDSIRVVVFLLNGISLIANVLLSSFSILARTFNVPPRCPSLYRLTSIEPPVGKSGYR